MIDIFAMPPFIRRHRRAMPLFHAIFVMPFSIFDIFAMPFLSIIFAFAMPLSRRRRRHFAIIFFTPLTPDAAMPLFSPIFFRR
jgi:hypothetical protein